MHRMVVGELPAGGHLIGNPLGPSPLLCVADPPGDGIKGYKQGVGDFFRGKAVYLAKRERNSPFLRQHGVTASEDQAKLVIWTASTSDAECKSISCRLHAGRVSVPRRTPAYPAGVIRVPGEALWAVASGDSGPLTHCHHVDRDKPTSGTASRTS